MTNSWSHLLIRVLGGLIRLVCLCVGLYFTLHSSFALADLICKPAPPGTVYPPTSSQAVYTATRNWDAVAQREYALWVEKNVTDDFMVQFSISTDCSRAAVVPIAVFARIHGLPFALTGDGVHYIGHDSTRFAASGPLLEWNESNWRDRLKYDRRFRSFLTTALKVLSTWTMPYNVYPLRLSVSDPADPSLLMAAPDVRPGAIGLFARHTRLVTRVDRGAFLPIRELQSTLPEQVRLLSETPFSLSGFPTTLGEGLVGWRWVAPCYGAKGLEWRMVDRAQMPGYSLEQYEYPDYLPEKARQVLKLAEVEESAILSRLPSRRAQTIRLSGVSPEQRAYYVQTADRLSELAAEKLAARRALKIYSENPDARYVGTFGEFMNLLTKGRVPTVDDALAEVASVRNRLQKRADLVQIAVSRAPTFVGLNDPSSKQYDELSTPDRDGYEKRAYLLLKDAVESADRVQPGVQAAFEAALENESVLIERGVQIDLALFFEALTHGFVSTDPAASLDKRWGLEVIADKKLLLAGKRMRLRSDEYEFAQVSVLEEAVHLTETQPVRAHDQLSMQYQRARSSVARLRHEIERDEELIQRHGRL